MEERRQARTVNQDPAVRHDPEFEMRLCEVHHSGYDGGLGGKKYTIEYLTEGFARGLCRFVDIRTGKRLGDN
jgi:hypothetical protein